MIQSSLHFVLKEVGQDGAPSHGTVDVMKFLKKLFGRRKTILSSSTLDNLSENLSFKKSF